MGMMKGMKKAAMKGMKKKAMKKSVIAKGKYAKSQVWKGTKAKTSSGFVKKDLKKNKYGKVVTLKKSALGKKNKWSIAFAKARAALKIKGFCPCGGKTAQGK